MECEVVGSNPPPTSNPNPNPSPNRGEYSYNRKPNRGEHFVQHFSNPKPNLNPDSELDHKAPFSHHPDHDPNQARFTLNPLAVLFRHSKLPGADEV